MLDSIQKVTVPTLTHDARIFEFADRMARMDDGRITEVTDGARGAAPHGSMQ